MVSPAFLQSNSVHRRRVTTWKAQVAWVVTIEIQNVNVSRFAAGVSTRMKRRSLLGNYLLSFKSTWETRQIGRACSLGDRSSNLHARFSFVHLAAWQIPPSFSPWIWAPPPLSSCKLAWPHDQSAQVAAQCSSLYTHFCNCACLQAVIENKTKRL